MSVDPTPEPSESEYLKRADTRRHMKVAEVLRRWDPIGVYGFDSDCPEDEYRSYEVPLIRRLDAGQTQQQITDFLLEVQTQAMGLDPPSDPTRVGALVDELIEFWEHTKPS